IAPLAEYERQCMHNAVSGTMADLADLLDRGSLRTSEAAVRDDPLGKLMSEVNLRLAQNDLIRPESVVTRYFGGLYYSWEQAVDIDALLKEIHEIEEGATRDYFLAALLAVASQAVNTVGKQFAQPIRPRDSQGRPKRHLLGQTLRDRSIDVFDAYVGWLSRMSNLPRQSGSSRAIRADYRDALADETLEVDVVYADPPYTRDHYSRFYHALETMALHDEPGISSTSIRTVGAPRASRGIYRMSRHQSPFSIKSQAPGAFDSLCGAVKARDVPLVLSYSPFNEAAGNRPRLLTTEAVAEIARRHFRRVDVRPVGGLKHNKLNVVGRNVEVDYVAEVLFVCLP
ncbi:MAG: DNA adenine methylase, partial [bacterium]